MKAIFKQLFSMFLSAVIIGSGMSVIAASAEQTDPQDEYILGDVNCDKKITLKDASLVQRAVLSLEDLSDTQYKLACVDGSELLSLVDAVIIQRYTLNIIDEYAVNSNGYIIGDAFVIDTDSEIADTDTDTNNTDSEVTDIDNSDTDSSAESYKVMFNCENTYAIVYYTKEFTDGKPANDEAVYSRNGISGEIDSSGEGEVNFSLYNNGFMIALDIKIDGEYDQLITIDNQDFSYRLTGIKSDINVTVTGYYGGDLDDSEVIDTNSDYIDTEETSDSDTDSADTEKEITDSEEPYEILPIEEIQYMLDGDFERGSQIGDTWKQGCSVSTFCCIKDMRRRNLHAGSAVFWVKLRYGTIFRC